MTTFDRALRFPAERVARIDTATKIEDYFIGKDKLYIRVKLSQHGVEYPLLIKSFVYNSVTEEVYSLHIGNQYYSMKTKSAILSAMYDKWSTSSCLLKIFYEKENAFYYVAPGLIMDAKFKPLMLYTGSTDPTSRGVAVYFHQDLFSREDGISKFIVTKILPYVASNPIKCLDPVGDNTSEVFSFVTANIKIGKEIENFFIMPNWNEIKRGSSEVFNVKCKELLVAKLSSSL